MKIRATILLVFLATYASQAQDSTATPTRADSTYLPSTMIFISVDYQDVYLLNEEDPQTGIGTDRSFVAQSLGGKLRGIYGYASTYGWYRPQGKLGSELSTHAGIGFDIKGVTMLHFGYGYRYQASWQPQLAGGLTIFVPGELFVQMMYERDISNTVSEQEKRQYLYLTTEWGIQGFAQNPLPLWAQGIWLQFAFRSDYGVIYGLQYDIARLSPRWKDQCMIALRRTTARDAPGILLGINYRITNRPTAIGP